MENKTNRLRLLYWVMAVLLVLSMFNMYSPQVVPEIRYSTFEKEISKGNVKRVRVHANQRELVVELKNAILPDSGVEKTKPAGETILKVIVIADGIFVRDLIAKNIDVQLDPIKEASFFVTLLGWTLPALIFVGLYYLMMRRMAGGGKGGVGNPFTFLKSKARQPNMLDQKTFLDVAGCDEAKEELREVVDFLKDPRRFTVAGGRMPKGMLLVGPPGTGKTLLARAVAGEAKAKFYYAGGSEFIEMFVGVGAGRVRDLFQTAKANTPCILFFDEIDSIGRHRGTGLGHTNDEREQTLNQLLSEMDGFESSAGIMIIAATNRPDVLDPALLRSGRFDRQVVVDKPDVKGREEILKIHARSLTLDPSVDLKVIAQGTPGFTGADLANLVNEAALFAGRDSRACTIQADFEHAKDKIIEGVERKSAVMNPKEKRLTAIHESGHTLVAEVLYAEDSENTDPVHKVSIIPRSNALGVTIQLPIDDRRQYTQAYLLNRLCIMLGGRAAEEFTAKNKNERTTGASDDLKRATELAHRMVCEWGMSDDGELGSRTYGRESGSMFLGRDLMAHEKDFSESFAAKIDKRVGDMIEAARTRATDILTQNKEKLTKLHLALYGQETLTGEEVRAILQSG